MGIIISTTSIASFRYIKILTWVRGFEGKIANLSNVSQSLLIYWVLALKQLRLNLCNMFCSSHNIVESKPLHWFGHYVEWLCWTKFNFHQTSSTTVFIFLLFFGAKETHSFILGQFTRILIFLNPQLFLSGFGFLPHVSGASVIRIRNFLKPLSRVEIFEYASNPESCRR